MNGPCGVLPIDKPGGMTSHDVVARVRRALSTKRVGHAGTLDPMATGVLVVLVGEATKLEPFLMSADKTYEAELALGAATDTLDVEGAVVGRAPIPEELLAELLRTDAAVAPGPLLRAALDAERARREQVPPAYSAIKVDGQKSYDLARKGAALDLPARAVSVRQLLLDRVTRGDDGAPRLTLRVTTSKGYYVRSLARDLAAQLGTLGHLTALRRLASGGFAVGQAIPLEAARAADLIAMTAALRRSDVPSVTLGSDDVVRIRQGKRVAAPEFEADRVVACLDEAGALVAMARFESGELVVVRGFTA